MNTYTLESFISFCDDMQIAEEKGLLGKIKSKLKTRGTQPSKKAESKNPNPENVTYTLKKASSSDFEHLYKTEAYCAEGIEDPDKDETAKFFLNVYSKYNGVASNIHFFWCKGKDLNTYYHLTDDNAYDDNLGIFFIDWSNFSKEFDVVGHKNKFRYFSDVVDNNARREIRKKNQHYKNYHSLYGDEWFYSTI